MFVERKLAIKGNSLEIWFPSLIMKFYFWELSVVFLINIWSLKSVTVFR